MKQNQTKPEPETHAELLALKLFKKRFPSQYEYRVNANAWGGYFEEWVYRFNKPDPTIYMDSETLQAYHEILEEIKGGII